MVINKIKVFIIILICIAVCVLFYLMFFYGTPWEKNRAKQEIQNYLKDKYIEEMSIQVVHYSFGMGYSAIANPKGNSDKYLAFRIDPIGNDKGYKDEYFNVVWQKEISERAEKLIKDICDADDYFIFARVSRNPLYSEYTNNIKNVPAYEEVKGLIKKYTRITLYLKKSFEESDYEKILSIVKCIGLSDLEFEGLEIKYTFNDTINKRFSIDEEDIEEILTIDDIKNLEYIY